MLFKEFNKHYKDFIQNSGREVLIFCPYIQVSSLKNILDGHKSKVSIITSWKTIDILTGISDLELYPFCKSIGAYLYINQRIHLKVICDSYHSAIVGSANITAKGLGMASNSNHECAVLYEPLDRYQQIYLRSILQESTLINDKEFEIVKKAIEECKTDFHKAEEYEDIDFKRATNKEFLISALPMSISIDTLFAYYSEALTSQGFADVDYDCAMHDLALYKFPAGLSRQDFDKSLKEAFFSQLFIQELRKFLSKERYFGAIKEWVQQTCVDVPVPSRRDLTENVRVLYNWVAELGKDEYIVDRPNHSERIRPKT